MAIGSAVQRGNQVVVFDERGSQIFNQSGTLVGFTGSTVSIRRGNQVCVFDEKGHFKYNKTA